MKFCQIDKISTRTCIFNEMEVCKLGKISIVTANGSDYMNRLWGSTFFPAFKEYKHNCA